ncbi:VWA domain-containing protein [Pyxidicoccus parkwayensis]|uniref:VWA domain-containing protein n=1 Tax=Pyxidicoccus parkwayensis TaxID=2813578 RepID=A0ABX7NRT7_9BACT|nr:VWA domain-containing protein [Pyxidicoccus parkwaysis]QSQ21111.1 VWA domain-containing protein [Pyxidicoccus parkwaysis]
MKSVFQRLFPRAAMSVACAAALTSGVASADEHVLVLLDRTGSMGLESVPGKTRFQVAKERINAFLDIVPPQVSKYSFWTFEGTGYVEVFSFAQNKTAAEVKAAVNAAVLGGNTPLAKSVCAAVDSLINYLPNQFHSKRIYMATDGEENATPNTDQCWGPSSANPYPSLDTNSWQWKVRNKACTGNANTPGPCSGGIPPAGLTLIVDIDHLYDFVPFQATTFTEDKEVRDSRNSFASAAAVNADAAFFGGLSNETHGRYAGITPSTPPAQATPVPGDATGDGCVNVADRSAVLAQYGQTVPAGTPTDFNRDGIVNIYDHNTVLQNYGRGCTTTAK